MKEFAISSPFYPLYFVAYQKIGEFKNGNWKKKKLSTFSTEEEAITSIISFCGQARFIKTYEVNSGWYYV